MPDRSTGWGEIVVFVKKMWSNRHSVILTWLFSYLAILFMPIIISLVVYNMSSKVLTEEIDRANNALLNQVRDVLDNQLDNIFRLNREISWSIQLQDLLYSNKTPSERQFSAYKVVQELKRYQSSYSFIGDFYVYSSKDDLLLLPGAAATSELAYEMMGQKMNLSYEDWLAMLKQKNNNGFVPLTGSQGSSLAYINSLPGDTDSESAGSVIILIDVESLLKTIAHLELFNGGDVFVLDPNSTVLLSNTGISGSRLSTASSLDEESGLIYEPYNGKDSEIMYISSRSSDLKYASIVPRSLFWEKAEYIRSFTYISILVSILGGCLLTFIFVRRNYVPIGRLVRTLSGSKKLHEEERGNNEFRLIEKMISRTMDEKEAISTRLNQQNHMLRSNTLVRLLKGKLDSQIPLAEALTTFNLSFETDDFAVLLLYLEEPEAFYARMDGMKLAETDMLLSFIVTNVFEELTGRKHTGYVTEIDNSLACLVNLKAGLDGERKHELLHIAEEAQQFLAERYKIGLTISISSIHSTTIGIARAYGEAIDAMEYKMVVGRRGIIAYDDIRSDTPDQSQYGYHYPLQAEQQLVNYMKTGDFIKAQTVLNDIMERNFTKPVSSIPIVKCLMFNLISTMIKTMDELGLMEESLSIYKPKEIERIIKCETVDELQNQLSLLLKEVCDYTTLKAEQKNQQNRDRTLKELAESIMQLVEAQFDDINMNISMIGNHFNMNPAYLSRIFKEQTNEGLLDFINKYRISQAKHYMTEHPDCSIGDIAKKVGFTEAATFIRTFKKYEGITPGKYKDL
jgi:two-component system response regulator YesN